MELSGEFPVTLLCSVSGIKRSSFYAWKKKLSAPSEQTKQFISHLELFRQYHLRYPSHGYRWLNAKIRLDTGIEMSDTHAHKCCNTMGIKSEAKRCRYRKPGEPFRTFPNLLFQAYR